MEKKLGFNNAFSLFPDLSHRSTYPQSVLQPRLVLVSVMRRLIRFSKKNVPEKFGGLTSRGYP